MSEVSSTTKAIFLLRDTYLDTDKHPEIATHYNQNVDHNSTQRLIMSNRQNTNQSVTRFDPPIELTISWMFSDEENQLFFDTLKRIRDSIKFTRLNIDCREITMDMSVSIIQLLPNLGSLKVLYLPRIRKDLLLMASMKVIVFQYR